MRQTASEMSQGELFPPLRQQLDTLPDRLYGKNGFVAIRSVFWAQNGQNVRLWPGLRPGPRWGSLERSPVPLAGLRGSTSKGGKRGKGKGRGREKEGEGKGRGMPHLYRAIEGPESGCHLIARCSSVRPSVVGHAEHYTVSMFPPSKEVVSCATKYTKCCDKHDCSIYCT